jgi:hypothetical protein
LALDTDEKQSLLEGDVYGAAGIEKSQAHSREMLMTLLGDREWESQLAVNTYEMQTSLERDVNGAVRGSRVGELVGRGHICKTKLTRGRC